jgi:ATP-dependent helicase YprA (DUF1998 family)
MHVFDLDSTMVENYSSSSRSFSKLRAPELKAAVGAQYADGHFWPDALLSINPKFEKGRTTTELAVEGMISSETAQAIAFHTYQTEAIAKGNSKKSFIVTTGLVSGHLATATCRYERIALVGPNHDAASRDNQCAN